MQLWNKDIAVFMWTFGFYSL